MSATLSSAPTTGARAAQEGSGAAPKKKSKLKLVVIVLLLVAVAGAAAWFFLLRGGDASAPQAAKAPEKGAVMVVDPININLADGHYLKLAFALQLSKGVKEDPDPSQALSIAIDQLSGQSMTKLSKPDERRKAVEDLKKAIEKAYGEDVIDLYPTTMVMQ